MLIQRIVARLLFPTKHQNWYKSKGYKGNNNQEIFADFCKKQRKKGALLYEAFEGIELQNLTIPATGEILDAVIIKPQKQTVNIVNNQKLIICFNGRKEFLEKRYKDMAYLAKITGASVLGFNPKGVNSSTGRTLCLQDYVNDGINVLLYALSQNWDADKIYLLGNSLGAPVQEMVSAYFRKNMNMDFKQINSNSFSNMGEVFGFFLKKPKMSKFFSSILKKYGWEIEVGANYYKIGPDRCYMWRQNDRVVRAGAQYRNCINFEQDYEDCPIYFQKHLKWLHKHAKLELIDKSKPKIQTHKVSLHLFKSSKLDSSGATITPFDFIRYFMHYSDKRDSKIHYDQQ